MNTVSYDHFLKQVVNCPGVEQGKPKSPCLPVIINDWVNLLGWGNPEAKIVFVGINPLYNIDAHDWHRPPSGRTPLDHAIIRSSEGASHVRHFSYHKRILRELKNQDPYLTSILPDTIDEFAFYTEVAFCPSTDQSKLSEEILARCFSKNVKPFILNSPFQVVVALGRIPSEICFRSFVSANSTEALSSYHGKVFRIPERDKYLITSYHPNAFGKWDRSAVAKIIYNLYSGKDIDLG